MMIVGAVSGALLPDVNNNQNLCPGRYEDDYEEYIGDYKGLNLSNAEAAIGMFMPICVMVVRKYKS